MMVTGMPRLTTVEVGEVRWGSSLEAMCDIGMRATGRDGDTVGLLVRRLWISCFLAASLRRMAIIIHYGWELSVR